MFEVTPSGEVVWEYLYPRAVCRHDRYHADSGKSDSANAWQVDSATTKGSLYSYRHYRYGADYPGPGGQRPDPEGNPDRQAAAACRDGRLIPAVRDLHRIRIRATGGRRRRWRRSSAAVRGGGGGY